ncbi:MAG: dihydrodipicolinate reductase [Myxococcota bacterium]
MERPIRVIQWATGSVGRHAIPAIVEDPALELAGVWVFSEEKEGVDAGTLAGIEPLGVAATRDVDALLALGADCVLYAPLLTDLDEMCRLLASGLDVVTPSGWVYLKEGKAKRKIEAACAEGRSSLHGTGIHPGFGGDRLPIVMSGLSRRIDRIRVIEVCNMSVMSESPEMVMGALGFGASADAARKRPPMLLGVMSKIFFESMDLIAAGLGFELDDHKSSFEFAVANEDLEVSAGKIPKGHVAGQHYEYLGLVAGEPVIEFQTYWRMSHDIEPNWPYDAVLEYIVEIDGEPPLRCSFGPVTDGESTEFGLQCTAMNCVNAIRPVCEAAPGIRTTLDLPPITARGRFALPGTRA